METVPVPVSVTMLSESRAGPDRTENVTGSVESARADNWNGGVPSVRSGNASKVIICGTRSGSRCPNMADTD